MTDVTLRTVPGDGLLIRTESLVLFIADGTPTSDVLLSAIDSGAPDSAFERVLAAVAGSGFDVPSFALIQWFDDVELAVFGDLTIATDHPVAPSLSAAASTTWIEHKLRVAVDTLKIETPSPAGFDGRTNLIEGRAAAGGFELELRGLDEPRPLVEQVSSPGLVDVPETSTAIVDEPPSVSQSAPDGLQTAVLPSSIGPASPATEPRAEDDELTITPDVLEETQFDGLPNRPLPQLTEARMCTARHANPPSSGACRVCEVLLDFSGDSLEMIEQPLLAVVAPEEGDAMPIAQTIVLGRAPEERGPQDATLRLQGTGLSRSHALIYQQGWDLYVEDLGSTNGTIVVASPSAEPVVLEGSVPHRIEVGATVYLGSTPVSIRSVPI